MALCTNLRVIILSSVDQVTDGVWMAVKQAASPAANCNDAGCNDVVVSWCS